MAFAARAGTLSTFMALQVPIAITQSREAQEQREIKLIGSVNAATVTHPRYEKRSCQVPVFENNDVECLVHTIVEFNEATSMTNLNFAHDPAKLVSEFRKCLGPNQRDKWDTYVARGNPMTLAGVQAIRDAFVAHYIDGSAMQTQKTYLTSYRKSHDISCSDLANRFTLIVKYMGWFPHATNPIYTPEELKGVYFGMMLEPWQIAFQSTTTRLDDPNYTFEQLVRYMSVQADMHNASRSGSRAGSVGSGSRRGGRTGRGNRRMTSEFRGNGHHPCSAQRRQPTGNYNYGSPCQGYGNYSQQGGRGYYGGNNYRSGGQFGHGGNNWGHRGGYSLGGRSGSNYQGRGGSIFRGNTQGGRGGFGGRAVSRSGSSSQDNRNNSFQGHQDHFHEDQAPQCEDQYYKGKERCDDCQQEDLCYDEQNHDNGQYHEEEMCHQGEEQEGHYLDGFGY